MPYGSPAPSGGRWGAVQGTVVTEVEEVRNYVEAEAEHQQYLSRGGRSGHPQSAAKMCTDPIRCYG